MRPGLEAHSVATNDTNSVAEFPTRPETAVIREFLSHVKTTGEPHSWQYHRHDRPARDAKPVVLIRFHLPHEIANKPDRRGKCPICAPTRAQYTWGYLVWFPLTEGGDNCLRAIGHDCGANYFGDDEYSEALAVFQREQDESLDRDYLARVVPLMSDIRNELVVLRPCVEAAQAFRVDARKALRLAFVRELARTPDAILRIHPVVPVPFVRADGSEGVRNEVQSRAFGRIAGAACLADGLIPFDQLLDGILADLGNLPAESSVRSLGTDDIFVLAKRLRQTSEKVRQLSAVVLAAFDFSSPENLSELQRWSRHPDSHAVVQIISLDGGPKFSVYHPKKVGVSELGWHEAKRVEVTVPPLLRQVKPTFPEWRNAVRGEQGHDVA